MSQSDLNLFIYCFRDFDEKTYFEELGSKYNLTYDYTSAYPSLDNAHLVEGYDSVSITPSPITAELLETYHRHGIRNLLTRSIGYEHIDLAAAEKLNMKVSHVVYPPDAVADYSIMLMMMCLRKMPFIMSQSHVQDFTLPGKMGKSLTKATVGVIGCGQIGQMVMQHLAPFGCKIYGYDPFIQHQQSDVCEYASLEKLLKECDVITLHAPANETNFHLLDDKAFSLMKPGTVIINTSRGALIDTDALIRALESGKVSSAALDVLENETNLYYQNRVGDCIDNHQMAILRSFPNVILTPHTAFYTDDTIRGMVEHTVQCLSDMKNNRSNPLIIVS